MNFTDAMKLELDYLKAERERMELGKKLALEFIESKRVETDFYGLLSTDVEAFVNATTEMQTATTVSWAKFEAWKMALAGAEDERAELINAEAGIFRRMLEVMKGIQARVH